MDGNASVLVCGVGVFGSAIVRELLLGGCTVALLQTDPPQTVRRRMALCDAWFGGVAALEGVEARRVHNGTGFLAGMQSRAYVPLLTIKLRGALNWWPWDAIVDTRMPTEKPHRVGPGMDAEPDRLTDFTELAIGVGPGFVAGGDVDLVVTTSGPDPGALIREGHAPECDFADGFPGGTPVVAPLSGIFHAHRDVTEEVAAGDLLGWIGAHAVTAPRGGLLRGVLHNGVPVTQGALVADVVAPGGPRISGIPDLARGVARSVALTIDLQRSGTARPGSAGKFSW